MSPTLSQNWNLESIFSGGSASDEFEQFLHNLQSDIEGFRVWIDTQAELAKTAEWAQQIQTVQTIAARLREAGAYVGCLNAQNVKDDTAKILQGKVGQISASLTSAFTSLDEWFLKMPTDQWEALLSEPEAASVQFSLEERRRRALDRLPGAEERLIANLSVDGYHGWSQLYDAIVGRMVIPFYENGELKDLSMGQAANKLLDDNRETREEMFTKWESAWQETSDLSSATLNHLAGYRLAMYDQRGWTSVLKEPLDVNRMSPETLQAMWGVIEQNKQPFADFLNRKAKLMNVPQLTWSDVQAPLGEADGTMTYEEARDFIVENFAKFSPAMAEFADFCFTNGWIEAEDRSGKRPGAFCTSFPVSKQTRIFTTFSGKTSNVATLAHELGHAYHQHVMRDMPQFAQNYAMNVAETASTFAEMIVADAAVRQARSPEEKVTLLEDKVSRSVAMFMNIHARFLFETRFYEQRKQGLVSVDRLNTLMVDAQRDAFGGTLASYHPHFWASKLHFYITGVPFYNFPYTFGYLFSTGIYARSLEVGPSFADKYVELLRDTASMTVEELARKHLGVDLTKPDFWQSAVDRALVDVREFLDMTK